MIIYIYMVGICFSWNFCNFRFDFKKNKTKSKITFWRFFSFVWITCLVLWQSDIFTSFLFTNLKRIYPTVDIILNIGRYIAINIIPTKTATKIIIKGSIIEVKLLTLEETSSS